MKSFNQFINQFIYEVDNNNNEVNGFCVLKPEFLSHTDDFLKLLSNNESLNLTELKALYGKLCVAIDWIQ